MKVVRKRNNLSPDELRNERVWIVMSWLAEFEFSSVKLLSQLLGLQPNSIHRFFKFLISEGMLVRFASRKFARRDLVRIGKSGVRWIEENLKLNVKNLARSDKLSVKSCLEHDLLVQTFLASIQSDFGNVIWERKIKSKISRPDALLLADQHHVFETSTWDLDQHVFKPESVTSMEIRHNYDEMKYLWINENAPTAVEFEYSRKSSKRFFSTLNSYHRMIREGRIKRVIFVFSDETMRTDYEIKFYRERWPIIVTESNRRLKRTGYNAIPLDHPVRNCFEFVSISL